jgi:hypothetical protein
MRALFGPTAPSHLSWLLANKKSGDPQNSCKTADVDAGAFKYGLPGAVATSPAATARSEIRRPIKQYTTVIVYGVVACAGMAAWVYFLTLAVVRTVEWILS